MRISKGFFFFSCVTCGALFSLVLMNLQSGFAIVSLCDGNDNFVFDAADAKRRTNSVAPADGVDDDGEESNDKIKIDYAPASTETYLMNNLKRLQLDGDDKTKVNNYAGCPIWKDKKVAPEIFDDLHSFRKDLAAYHDFVDKMEPLPDIMDAIRERNDHSVCDAMRLHPDGIPHFFPSGQLSHGTLGYAEPLLTPMRHPDYCLVGDKALMDMNYMVIDYEKLCRNLKPHSRTVLIDMGASLTFGHVGTEQTPIMYLLNEFKKFGFRFDHIYGYEITFEKPEKVFNELIPTEYVDAYHWINTGISSEEGNRMNPLDSILRKFKPDDLVFVKLDMVHAVEVPLATQLLNDESLYELVDHFFFEHHVLMKEIHRYWHFSATGSVKSSFDLFQGLREKGVVAHFWP